MMLQSFPTTVGVSQGCLLSPLLFNLFLESIVRETLYKIHSTISVGGRIISDMRFAGDIDPLGCSNQKKKVPPRTHLQTRPTRKHAWEKFMVNLKPTHDDIAMNGNRMKEVEIFNQLVSTTFTKDGRPTTEVRMRLGQQQKWPNPEDYGNAERTSF